MIWCRYWLSGALIWWMYADPSLPLSITARLVFGGIHWLIYINLFRVLERAKIATERTIRRYERDSRIRRCGLHRRLKQARDEPPSAPG